MQEGRRPRNKDSPDEKRLACASPQAATHKTGRARPKTAKHKKRASPCRGALPSAANVHKIHAAARHAVPAVQGCRLAHVLCPLPACSQRGGGGGCAANAHSSELDGEGDKRRGRLPQLLPLPPLLLLRLCCSEREARSPGRLRVLLLLGRVLPRRLALCACGGCEEARWRARPCLWGA